MNLRINIIIIILVLATVLSGCGKSIEHTNNSDDSHSSPEKIVIYTTIFPLEDFSKKIGGDFVEVKSVLPPNVDAHTFEITSKTMADLAIADLFIYTGAGIEGFADKAIESLKNEKVKTVKAGQNITFISSKHDEHSHEDEGQLEEQANHEDEHGHEDEASHEDEHEHGDYDPHVWLDPLRAIQLASTIRDSLVGELPEQESYFNSNFEELKQNLTQLDNEYSNTIQDSKTKYILVSHAAYGYWQERYGIEQIAIAGLSPTQEPSQKQLVEIIEESKIHNIKYVIFEQNVSPKVSQIIQTEIGAQALQLHNLEAVTDDDIKNNEDYFSIMQKNLDTLKTALY